VRLLERRTRTIRTHSTKRRTAQELIELVLTSKAAVIAPWAGGTATRVGGAGSSSMTSAIESDVGHRVQGALLSRRRRVQIPSGTTEVFSAENSEIGTLILGRASELSAA